MFKRKDPAPPKPAGASALGESVDIGTLRDPLLQQAIAVWNEQKGANRFPAREAMTPRVMAPFLRNIVLVRVIESGADYEFRVVGDAIVQVQGAAFQGLTLAGIDAQLPGYGAALRPIYDALVAEGTPRGFRGHIQQSPIKRAFAHETLLLPLGKDAAVDHILVVGVYAYTVEQPPPDGERPMR
ncbi:MAG TPA: PAS domain-containing protein [Rhizomicrobium sp.]|nr:PAS domain-containing protein [Rhizomicrobium sp.]